MKDETELKIGDTVELNSGGPEMTIIKILGGGYLLCGWWNNESEYNTLNFPVACVTKLGKINK